MSRSGGRDSEALVPPRVPAPLLGMRRRRSPAVDLGGTCTKDDYWKQQFSGILHSPFYRRVHRVSLECAGDFMPLSPFMFLLVCLIVLLLFVFVCLNLN